MGFSGSLTWTCFKMETVNLTSGYGKAQVVRGVSVHLQEQQILGIIGRNGVGKTTLVKTIIGLLPVMSGSVFIHGQDVTGRAAHLISRMKIGYVPQGRGIFPGMTVYEHLVLGSYLIDDASKRQQRIELIHTLFRFCKKDPSNWLGC